MSLVAQFFGKTAYIGYLRCPILQLYTVYFRQTDTPLERPASHRTTCRESRHQRG